MIRALWAAAVASIVAIAALHPPHRTPIVSADILASAARALVYWSSILLEAMPFVVAGSIAAEATKKYVRAHLAAPLMAMFFPGCDCSLNGFASAMTRVAPAAAGFSLTWGAVAAPASLVATHVALGDRVLAGRIVGAAVAACLTAAAWRICTARGGSRTSACDTHRSLADQMAGVIGALSVTAAAATVVSIAPSPASAFSNVWGAAAAGALLSPCSTADAVIARVLVHDRGAQAAFVVASQCVDVRQLAMFARHFGATRTVLAALAGCIGCYAAWLVAR